MLARGLQRLGRQLQCGLLNSLAASYNKTYSERIMNQVFTLKCGFALALMSLANAAQSQIQPAWVTLDSPEISEQLIDAVTTDAGSTYVALTVKTGPTVSDVDIGIKRFDASGALVWSREFAGPIGQDIGADLALSWDQAFVYVLGRSIVPGFGNSDFTVLKYDAMTGDLIWSQYVDGGDLGIDSPYEIVGTPDGGAAATGGVDTPNEQRDFGTVKLDADGNVTWFSYFTGYGPFLFENDDATDIAADSNGDIIITGNAMQGNNTDIVTIKYDGITGDQLWQAIYSTTPADVARDLEITAEGDVVVLGQDPFGLDHQWMIVKYDGTTGEELWVTLIDPGQDEGITDLYLGTDGTIYATGGTDPDGDDGNGNGNLIVVACDPVNGALKWLTEFGDEGYFDGESGSGLQDDGAGFLYVSGYTSSESLVPDDFDADALILKLDIETGLVVDLGLVDTTLSGEPVRQERFYHLRADDQRRMFAVGVASGDVGAPTNLLLVGYSSGTVAQCSADVNLDGQLTPADFSAWVAAFNTQSPACDQNSDGKCSPADFGAWVANYNSGC